MHGPVPVVATSLAFVREKGFHNLVEAFLLLRQDPSAPRCRLRVSGWLGANDKPYFEELKKRLESAGLLSDFEHIESPDFESKIRFLQSIDILSVPTNYREPKGLYVLEALANGVPVVQPRHGSFPELIESTGGGVLVEPGNAQDLARGLRQLLDDLPAAAALGRRGKEIVHNRFNADRMARETLAVYERYVGQRESRSGSAGA